MPNLKDFSILIQPGLNDSGPDHWHTHWEQAFPDFVAATSHSAST